jgi:sigma-E factor negative regulatory protein RseA
MQKEQLSALMDGEAFDSELLSSLSDDKTLQKSWQSYHVVRDTLRGDIGDVVYLDIAERVAAALEQEPIVIAPSAIKESQPHPSTWRKWAFGGMSGSWGSQLAQIGVAACVSLAVIVGVQHYSQSPATSNAPETPAFNTLPLMGKASPVSFGVPGGSVNGQQNLQEQRKRINVILQDYELQRRLHADQIQLNTSPTQQAAIQVPGTQSLGTQAQ